MARIDKLQVKNKIHNLPIFLPDATLGVVRGLSSLDLIQCGTRGCVVNTYHLASNPGKEILNTFDGIKKFMGFEGLVISDSGGWQVFSLIHRNKGGGVITDDGVVFSIGGKKKEIFTPEDSIRMQFDIGSDIIICLDDFTPPNTTYEKCLESVERTTHWAKRSKEEYLKQIEERKVSNENRPLIFAVIQGDRDKKLRKKSFEDLYAIGFDGFGYGGYMIDANGSLDLEMSKYIVELIPDDTVSFALGTGTPWQIASLYTFGWDIFDCTLPTRDARHGRLYIFKDEIKNLDLTKKESYEFVNIRREVYREDISPISNFCGCYTCKNYSKAYLHHLFKIKDISVLRLLTIHNLYLYNEVINNLV